MVKRIFRVISSRCFVSVLLAVFSLSLFAQNADKLYEEGKKLYDAKDYVAAFPKLKAAAEKGHKKAQYRLGRLYDKGNGTEENEQLAFEWYQKSAKQGYAKALYWLGDCYKDGKGVAKDYVKAFDLFMQAAKQGNADGEYAVGKAYFKGRGVTADKALAKKWLSKAVKNAKGGDEVVDDLRKDAKKGNADAKAMMALVGVKE